MSNEITLDVLLERIRFRKELMHQAYPCETDYLNISERLDYYRLKEVQNASVIGADQLHVGVYCLEDQVQRKQIVGKLSQDLGVPDSVLVGFHLDVLKGMISLRSGSWLQSLLNERLLRQLEVEEA